MVDTEYRTDRTPVSSQIDLCRLTFFFLRSFVILPYRGFEESLQLALHPFVFFFDFATFEIAHWPLKCLGSFFDLFNSSSVNEYSLSVLTRHSSLRNPHCPSIRTPPDTPCA